MVELVTNNLDATFKALQNRDPIKVARQSVHQHPDYKKVPSNNYAPVAAVDTGGWGNGMSRFASGGNAGVIYGQPQFFSPVHTPINWQIPSKRLEQYQWSRFFYENEPKVAAAIDFYSQFPMSDWEHECKNREVKIYFDKFKKKLQLPKWCRMLSHEIHLLGDCFPFIEIDCPHCGGSGKIGDEMCDHEGGTAKRVIILNPDFIELHSTPLNPEPMISMRANEELTNMVQKRMPGYEKLSPEVIQRISTGQPILLDNRSVSHLKYGECGYQKFGIGMVRRLFPILSYKTKLMVAQWIVAERLIVPIKVVKVGTDERPAGPADIAAVQAQLANTGNDPNLTIVTHHAFDLDWYGASGKVLTLSNEFEFINQEILDGMMINNALLNGEGPNFSAAAVGIEAMIQRLTTFRSQITEWIEEFIYLPEAKRQGFTDINPETGEEEWLIPKMKWNSMHLRDQREYRNFVIQLYEKGLLSAQTVLETFDFDPDQEIERKRFDALQMVALGQGFGQSGMGGDAGGMGGGGMPPMDGGGGGMGGEAPITPGGGPGAVGGEAAAPTGMGGGDISMSTQVNQVTADVANPQEFGGKVLKKKSRDRVASDQQKMYQAKSSNEEKFGVMGKGKDGMMRDDKGQVVFTGAERALIPLMQQAQTEGLMKDCTIYPQFRVASGTTEYQLDFAIPTLKIAIEADGEIFHSAPKQVQHDQERDMRLQQQGWTVVRYTDTEIDTNPQLVKQDIVKTVMQKQMWLQNQLAKTKQK